MSEQKKVERIERIILNLKVACILFYEFILKYRTRRKMSLLRDSQTTNNMYQLFFLQNIEDEIHLLFESSNYDSPR